MSISLLGVAASVFGQSCAAPPNGLSAWYTFDEPLFAKANRIPGKVGSALHFNGASDYFELPPAPALRVGDGSFSVEAWVRTRQANAIRNIFDHRNFGVTGYLLYIRSGAAGFQVAGGGLRIADAVATSYPIADGKWHHVVAVVKRLPPQPIGIYVDGAIRTGSGGKIASLANLDHDEPAWIARHRRNEMINRDNIFFAGDVDELSVYRRALEPNEIRRLFAAGSKGKCKLPAVKQ